MVFKSIFTNNYLSLVTADIRPYLEKIDDDTNKYSKNKIDIETLESQFFSIAKDYVNAYIAMKIAPDNPEYQNNFNNIKNKLNETTASLLSIKQNIEMDIQNYISNTDKLNVEIKKEKERNEILNDELNEIRGANAGSSIMIKNFREMYRKNYYTNAAMLAGILGSLFLLYKVSQYPSVFSTNYNDRIGINK